MKILITSDIYKPAINGVVTSTATLKKGLEARGHEVRVLTLGKKSRIDINEDTYYLSSIGVEKIYPGARVALKNDRDYLRDIILWGPDVIHTQTEFSTFFMAKSIAKYLDNIPVVHTYHTLYEDYTHYFSPSKNVGKKVVKSMSKVMLNTVQAVIAPTDKVGNLLDEYDIDTPVFIIPTGINLDPYMVKYTDRNTQKSLRKQYGIPKNSKVLLSVGRLGKEKNVQEVLGYLSELKTDIDYRFVIVGDGPYRDTLEKLVTEYGLENKVIFTGMVPNDKVADYYKLGDVFTSASTSETQGLTYIEAFASHTPGLCRKDDVLSHVLRDGETGFNFTNSSEFETLFNQMMSDDDLRQELGDNAQKLAFKDYSSESFAESVEAVYEKVIQDNFALAKH